MKVILKSTNEKLINFAAWLRDVTYKPELMSVVIQRDDFMPHAFNIRYHFWKPDSTDSDHPFILITFVKQVWLEQLEFMPFDKIVRDHLIEAEIHEIDEWMKFKNELIRNPH